MSNQREQSRRNFLRSTVAGAAAIVAGSIALRGDGAETKPSTSPAPLPASRPDGPFTKRLVGPIFSNPCPFTATLEPDDDALRKAVARALKCGIGIFACTAGNTLYATLKFDEVKRVNRVLIESVNKQGMAIAATGDWATADAVNFAHFAESAGADALQVMRPKHAADDDAAVRHYETVARSTSLPLVLHGVYTDELLRKLMEIDSIVAMKEDATLEDLIRRQIDFGQRMRIFAGGAENRFLIARPYGMRAFYSTYTTFAPDISKQFWDAIRTGDEPQAVKITLKYDYPFIRRFSHPFWHATLEYFGLGTRHIRPPHVAYTDEQMKQVREFFEQRGLSAARYGD